MDGLHKECKVAMERHAELHHPFKRRHPHRWFGLAALVMVFFQMAACSPDQTQTADKDGQPVKYGPDVRTLTVTGTIDPRLYASVRTIYRPTDYDERDRACTRSDWNTARRKGMLDWEVARIEPDENNRYEVTVPIDYVREDRCSYEFVATVVHIRRDRRDEQYAEITLLSSFQEKNDTYGSHGNNWPDDANVRSRKTIKPHYRLARESRIQCHTDYFEYQNGVLFNCYPLGGDGVHGVNEVTSAIMEVNIHINEKISKYFSGKPFSDIEVKRDRFRDYSPPPPGVFERLQRYIDRLFR